jgi:hypothetical protein
MDKAHLKVLEDVSRMQPSRRISADATEWPVYKELWESQCFEGLDHRDHKNRLDMMEIDGLSPIGRSTLDELRSVWTSVGFIRKHRWKIYAWFFGIIATIIVYWLTKA